MYRRRGSQTAGGAVTQSPGDPIRSMSIPANPGALPDVPDVRDFRWDELGAGSPAFDWSVGFDIEEKLGQKLEVNDQDGSTSCGGQAFSKYAEVLELAKTASYERRSAAFVYRHTAVPAGDGTYLGSRMRDNADFLRNVGVSLESLCPSYDKGRPPRDSYIMGISVTDAMRASAKTAKAASYAYVTPGTEAFARAIRDQLGVVVLLGGEDNGTWRSAFPKPPTYRQWGHFVYAGKAKLINGKRYIGILNSWGEGAGEDGWQWLGEDYFASGFIESGLTMLFTAPEVPSYQFTRDLTVGSKGVDVQILQRYLNRKGFPVAESGPGSPGSETTYFGSLTRKAVARYQAANGITPSVGYFGPKTRAHVNANQ